jgi:hypothetical protein
MIEHQYDESQHGLPMLPVKTEQMDRSELLHTAIILNQKTPTKKKKLEICLEIA